MKEIDELFAAWANAIRRGDIDALLGMITEDVELWPRDTPAIRGRENVRSYYASFFANFSLQHAFDETERLVEGGLAFVRGIERTTLTPRSGGAAVDVPQRAFMLLRLDADGHWRFARWMTNRESAQ